MSEPKHDMARKGCQPLTAVAYMTPYFTSCGEEVQDCSIHHEGTADVNSFVLDRYSIGNTWYLILQCKFATLKHMTIPVAKQLMHARDSILRRL